MNPKTKKRDSIILTVDIAVTINSSEILLIKRAKEPFMDKFVLPGGHFELSDPSATIACVREALEEINLKVDPKKLSLLTILDKPDRDPRKGRRISIVYTINLSNLEKVKNCRAESDALSIEIKNLKDLSEKEVGFDHWEAIKLLN
jgi:ADP-ribose pyrophosphatase YjhB (NUDIX family)